jgi:Mn2+/Fe2+ NRAMP family transporter
MQHNIYLHSALVQSRQLAVNDDVHKREALMYYAAESALSLLVRWLNTAAAAAAAAAMCVHVCMCVDVWISV